MRFVNSPNLPKNYVKLVAAGNYPQVIDALNKLGTKVIILADNQNIQNPVRKHADMTLLHLGNDQFMTFDEEMIDYLTALGGYAERPVKLQSKEYPQDIALNCLFIGDKVICNTKYCANEVLQKAENTGRKIINIKQGYARCSVAVIDERSVITADEVIAQSMSGEDFDVLCIRPGYIELPGYDYGFIGGCCGKLSKDTILFCGDPSNHPDGKAIKEFICKRGIEIITTDSGKLFDFGGIIQIFE